MARLLCLLLLAAAAGAGESDLEKARGRVRGLEEEIQRLIDEVGPAVGAVVNHLAVFDAKTGAVTMRPRSLGSGTVVSPDGFFLTNVHVVEGAGYLTVTLPDGQRYPAALYADTTEGAVKGDIALLKLRGKKRFPYVDWRRGRSGKLEPGSFVFAMGNPHGHALDGTPVVTMGIISGKGRAAAESGYLYVDALQTDAEINPGNSGGPLFDADGFLVGINGLMASRQGRSNSGVGFAIPIDQVKGFMRLLLREEGGGVAYGFHGLRVDTVEGGARVVRVAPRSPAEEAGLQQGDTVIRVNSARIANRTEFVNIVGRLPENALVKITYRRGRRTRVVQFRLANYEEFLEESGRSRRPKGPLPLHERGFLGAHWEGGRAGLRLTRILPGTGAEKAGLAEGDIILECEETPVGGPEDLVRILGECEEGTVVRIAYERAGKQRNARVELCDAARAAELGE